MYHSTPGWRVIKKQKARTPDAAVLLQAAPLLREQRQDPAVWMTGFGLQVVGFGFRVSGFGFRVSRFEFRISVFKSPVSYFGRRFTDFGFRVEGFTFTVWGLEMQEQPMRGKHHSCTLSGMRSLSLIFSLSLSLSFSRCHSLSLRGFDHWRISRQLPKVSPPTR